MEKRRAFECFAQKPVAPSTTFMRRVSTHRFALKLPLPIESAV